jgi:hypothetical protein
VYLALWSCLAPRHGPLDLVKQGQHITRITRIALRDEVGKDKTSRGFGGEAGLAAKLRRAIALAFDNRRNGGIVGIDQFTVPEFLACGQALGLLTDAVMVAHGCREGERETFPLGLTQGTPVFEALLGLEAQGFDGRTEGQELAFSVAYQLDEDVPLPSTAAAKTTHDLLQCLREVAGLALELGGPGATLRGDVVNEG